MPIFEIETPQGKYQVESPDEDTAIQALQSEQASPAQWSPQAEADAAEKLTGTGTFSDMTNSGMAKAIPFGDEIVSGFNAPLRAAREWWQGDGFDVPRAYDRNMQVEAEMQKRRDERSPIASTVGAVAGGVGASAPLAAGGFSFLNGAKPTLLSMGGRGAAEGAAYGGAYGAGEGRGLKERGYNAGFGTVLGALTGGATGALARSGAGSKVADEAIPSKEGLKDLAQKAYQAADDAGVVYTPEAYEALGKGIVEDVVNSGYHARIHPKIAGVLDALGEVGDGPVGLNKIEQLRRIAGAAAQSVEPDERRIASIIIDNIDNFTASMTDDMVARGDAEGASKALSQARDYWSRLRKTEKVENALYSADLRSKASGSGGNIDNASRQRVASLLLNPKQSRGFTDAERSAMEKLVRGSKGQNLLRLAGKLSPQGNGLMAALGIGGTMANPLIGVASLGGMGAKAVADGLTSSQAAVVDALIRNGGQELIPAMLSGPRRAIVEALIHGAGPQLPGYKSP